MEIRTGIRTVWASPDRNDRNEDVARGERACGVVEVVLEQKSTTSKI